MKGGKLRGREPGRGSSSSRRINGSRRRTVNLDEGVKLPITKARSDDDNDGGSNHRIRQHGTRPQRRQAKTTRCN